MEKVALQLYKARDAEEAFGIRFPRDEKWLACSGFGSDFEPVWRFEVEGKLNDGGVQVDWSAVLPRAVEAYRLSDPIITNFQWPTLQNPEREPL